MADTPRRKRQIGFRLSDEAREILRAIGQMHGLTMTGALELVIREAAEKRGILPTQEDQQP